MRLTDVNYRYFYDFVKGLPNATSLRVLDFGCGYGEVVRMLRDAGIEAYGVEVANEGSTLDQNFDSPLWKEGLITLIPETGEMPFPEKHFDVILSNQVLEHVEQKGPILRVLDRHMKDGGFMLHHFPIRDVILEPHIRIPFAHRMRPSRFRWLFTALMCRIGFGSYDGQGSIKEWTTSQLHWLDHYTFYLSKRKLNAFLSKEYVVSYHELRYCRYRASGQPLVRALLGINALTWLYNWLFRKLGFVAIELRKKPASQ